MQFSFSSARLGLMGRGLLALWLLALWLVTALLPPASAEAADAVPWQNSVEEARASAAHSQRLVFIHFWSESCGPCLRLEKTTFHKREFARALQTNYIPVKINVGDRQDLARKYKIDRIPTDLILTADGQELYRTISPSEPHKYVSMLDQVAAHARVAQRAPAQSELDASETVEVRPASEPKGPATRSLSAPPREAPPREVTNPYLLAAPPQRAEYRGPVAQQTAAPTEVAGRALSRYSEPTTTPSTAPPAGYQPYSASPPIGNPYAAAAPPPAANLAQAAPPQYGPRPPAAHLTMGDDLPGPTEQHFPPQNGPRWQGPAPAANSATAGGFRETMPPPRLGAPRVTMNPQVNQPHMQTHAPAPRSEAPPHNLTGTAPVAVPAGERPGLGGAPPGLDGFCPVSLVEDRAWRSGNPQWLASHEGRIYFLASPEHQEAFRRDPRRYAPTMAGFDVVRFREQGALVPGKREHGISFRGRYYLFADEASLQRFCQAPLAFDPNAQPAQASR